MSQQPNGLSWLDCVLLVLVIHRNTPKSSKMYFSAGVAKCDNGLVPSHYHWRSQEEFVNTSNNIKLCQVFLQAFVDEFDGSGGDFLLAYHKGMHANVWKDFGKMSYVLSFLLACGTSKVQEGNTKSASKYASLGSYFEQY
mmetsp:Transcript_9703/g.16047  ORF Transcript_9703/g.16047 Transcript_9703/m.16047 type:complete len:140 (-) Transcript_9703:248-667(-)